MFRAISHQTRRHPGRHLQPAVFYSRAGQGIGGPSMGDVTASKLEYADDVGLLDWTVAEASERVSALASGSGASTSMEKWAPKSKGMHVHIRERIQVSTEVEVEALDPPTQLPRMREEFSNVTRIDGAPSSLVPPGRRNFFLHFDSGHQHKPRHIAPPTLPDVLVTSR